jgi:hypothetical protein
MLKSRELRIITPSTVDFNIDQLVDALKNSMTGNSYIRKDGLSTFLDVDGYEDSEDLGVIILDLGSK